MPNTPQPVQSVCNHERRPGTTVCLHCRHAERLAATQRRKKLLLRGSAAAIVVAVGAVTVSLSANALRGRLNESRKPAPVQMVASAEPAPIPADSNRTPTTLASNPAPAAPAPSEVAQQGVSPTPPLVPVIAAGESVLADSVTALRSDSVVMLSFDTPTLRTRMPEKFERFLRTTLRQVYGAAIDSSLAKIPQGGLVSQGDLLRDLPTRGIHVPVSATWKLDVFPEVRPGKDGPLIVRYRASLSTM